MEETMKKNKLSIIFTILTCICIFSVAAIIDQCGCRGIPIEEKIDVGETEEEMAEGEASADEEEISEEVVEEDEPEEFAEEEESEEQETPEQEEQTEAPTIELEIYEGPLYSQSDNICFYRVKANITGTPTPDVAFSKDDSNGAWGEFKTQINLSDPADIYTLTATATNSEGTDTDFIDLSWGCPIHNNPPEITGIVLPNNVFVIIENETMAIATDPDGDNLTYYWEVTDAIIDDPSTNPMIWRTHDWGSHDITVTVDDGKGGTATKTVSVGTTPEQRTLSLISNEGGEIERSFDAFPGGIPYVGDSERNNPVRGFISFDISGLPPGAIVVEAHLEIKNPLQNGVPEPPLMEGIYLAKVYWGPRGIELGDYDLPKAPLGEYSGSGLEIDCHSTALIEAIQNSINNGQPRVQFLIRHKGIQSNNNGIWDGWRYQTAELVIHIAYH